jgi:hypothetical protein
MVSVTIVSTVYVPIMVSVVVSVAVKIPVVVIMSAIDVTPVMIPVVHCCTGRAVACTIMMVAIVSAVPSVTHTEMTGGVMVDIVVTTTMVPTSSSYDMPGMSTTIRGVEDRATIVEIVTMRIACIDGEVPETVTPVEWTIEVGGCTESA